MDWAGDMCDCAGALLFFSCVVLAHFFHRVGHTWITSLNLLILIDQHVYDARVRFRAVQKKNNLKLFCNFCSSGEECRTYDLCLLLLVRLQIWPSLWRNCTLRSNLNGLNAHIIFSNIFIPHNSFYFVVAHFTLIQFNSIWMHCCSNCSGNKEYCILTRMSSVANFCIF